MTKKVIKNVLFPVPKRNATGTDISVLITQLVRIFSDYGFRLNEMLPRDGSEGLTEYTVATLPTGVSSGLIAVTDEAGGHTLAFYDGTDWRRVQDRAIVS